MRKFCMKNPNGEHLVCYIISTLVNFILKSSKNSIFNVILKFHNAIVFLFKKGSEGEWIR